MLVACCIVACCIVACCTPANKSHCFRLLVLSDWECATMWNAYMVCTASISCCTCCMLYTCQQITLLLSVSVGRLRVCNHVICVHAVNCVNTLPCLVHAVCLPQTLQCKLPSDQQLPSLQQWNDTDFRCVIMSTVILNTLGRTWCITGAWCLRRKLHGDQQLPIWHESHDTDYWYLNVWYWAFWY